MSPSPFDPHALELAVQRHLAANPIPEGKKGAFFTVGNHDGVKAGVALRVKDRVELGTYLDVERDPNDDTNWDVEYGVTLKGYF